MIGLYFTLVAYGLITDAHVRSHSTFAGYCAGYALVIPSEPAPASQTRHKLLGIILFFTLVLEIVGFVGVEEQDVGPRSEAAMV